MMSRISIVTMIVTLFFLSVFTFILLFHASKTLKFMERIVKPLASCMFSLFMFLFMMVFVLISLYLSEINEIISPLLSAAILVTFWRIVQKLSEKSGLDDFLTSSDKQWITLFSLVAVASTGIVFSITERSPISLTVTCVAASIAIGAYVPITAIISDSKWQAIWKEIKKPFVDAQYSRSTIISGLLFLLVTLILVFTIEQNLLNEIGQGIGLGLLAFIVMFVIGLAIFNNRLKNKLNIEVEKSNPNIH